MKLETFVLGPMQVNTYLYYDEQTKKGIVFDPGMGPEPLIKRIQELDLTIESILLTHAHFDHIGGLEEVRKLTKAPVFIHEQEAHWLQEPSLNGSGFWIGFPQIICKPAEKLLRGNETLHILDHEVQVIHTPGHSPGGVTYHFGSFIISGDVLFKQSIGRTDLPGGSYDTLMETIQRHFMDLPEETIVYPGHGPATTIGQEQMSNPFIVGF